MPSTTTPAPLLQVHNLSFSYPQHPVFQDLTLHIPPGVTLVRGGDGVGKTTLLRLLAGELSAHAGSLHLGGAEAQAQPEAYRSQVFWTDPRSTAWDPITPLQYLAQQRLLYPHFLAADAPELTALLHGLGLEPYLEKPLYMLSTGSKRKVWLAAAFASGAALILLDDPLAALDKPSVAFVLQCLAQIAAQSKQICVVTHYEALAGVPLMGCVELGE
jgi:ABC-type multidrug transport system ATPase subunit